MTYCFDIDGTLCTNTEGAYQEARPLPDAIARVNRLYEAGHTILLYTGRGSGTGMDWRTLTQEQLRQWGVRYHKLYFGKPPADVYIDDKATAASEWHGEEGRLVWHNGRLIPEAQARVSIYDSALMFGDMVFEMTRSFRGMQFKLREHLDRLYASLAHVRISLTMTKEAMEQAVYETIEANQPAFQEDDEHRVMINVSRGALSIYEDVAGAPSGPQVMIADFPLRWTVAGMGHLFDVGINGVIPSQRAIPSALLEATVKHRSRLHFMRANIEVSQSPGKNNWAILLDPDGFLAEGTGDNVFLVKRKVLLTPEGRNILCGISRAYVLEELAPQLGLTARTCNLGFDDLMKADEIFLTATPFCMLPVTSVHQQRIGDGAMGPITRMLLSRWSQNVGIDIVEQIKAWDRVRPVRRSAAPSPYVFGQAAR